MGDVNCKKNVTNNWFDIYFGESNNRGTLYMPINLRIFATPKYKKRYSF